jgi:hypothetical protein
MSVLVSGSFCFFLIDGIDSGYMLASNEEAVARFSCKAARPPPQASRAVDLHWLVQLFAQRLGAPNSELNVVVSIHCTWDHHVNVHAGWQQPVAVAPGARHRECLWGPDADPVNLLQLATTSQVTLPIGTASIAGHQQLDGRGNTVPEMCPRWSLMVELERDDPKRRKDQAPLAGSFQQLMDTLSEAEGFSTIRQAADHRPMLEVLRLLPDSGVPTAQELSLTLTELFAVHHPSVFFVDQVQSQPLPSIKSAPPLTLLASLCMYMLNVESLAAVSVVWLEFCKELRWHWDHFELLPRTPFATPGLAYSKLYQRVQMLNWCIAQRRERNERAKAGTAVVAKAALGGWSDTEAAAFESVSSSDEGENGVAKPAEQVVTSAAPALQDDLEGREGVKECLSLKLLRSGAPMCAPFTQDGQTFVTEDSIAEQQTLLLSLGGGKAGSEMRAQMQSLSLLSDMEAFRAANPDCILQVRLLCRKHSVLIPSLAGLCALAFREGLGRCGAHWACPCLARTG